MATSNYKPYEQTGEPFTLGYFVFDLPNGQTLDLLSDEPVVLPDGDLSNLPMRYVERDVRFGSTPPRPKKVRVPVVIEPIVGFDPLNLAKLSDAEMEQLVFGDVQPR